MKKHTKHYIYTKHRSLKLIETHEAYSYPCAEGDISAKKISAYLHTNS